ncbi:MAG: nickel pincer cofactor biosynthesis protein LarC [Firmicutes bacterium]|nr:nickel pincer cofactor biosynthesis protein LarC [Bacillota bacterium]MBQ4092019.1 nickel pincer cofactor biosynthesis protein LarC [Bacillota bacterium]
MNIAYLDPIGGIAGDMFLSALLDALHDDSAEDYLLSELNKLNLSSWQWKKETAVRGGFSGTKIDFSAKEESCHRHLSDIFSIVQSAHFPTDAENKILKTFDILAEAEAKVHGTTKEEVHFHEVGAVDTILDICAVCLLLTKIHLDKLICAPLPMGNGTVKCAHGEIPLPAPAVAEMLKGAAIRESSIKGETVTPTGIALLKAFDAVFGGMPSMKMEYYGCGCGTRDGEVPNILRIFIGSIDDTSSNQLYRLECTIDDMTGEDFGFLWEHISKAKTNDMYYTPIYMKKGRPAIKLTVLAEEPHLQQIKETIFRYTSTLGMICEKVERSVLDRHFETFQTPYGKITYKFAEGFGVKKAKAEYEDLKKIADNEQISLSEARRLADSYINLSHMED